MQYQKEYHSPLGEMLLAADDEGLVGIWFQGAVHFGRGLEPGVVTNSRSVGGFRNLIGKQVGFDDGVFEVTLIKTPKNPIELQEIIAALMIQQMDSKYMYTFKSGRIMFESIEEIPWTLDGEFGGEHDEVVIENLNKELQIMVPGTHEED